jgi:hypothetical protein
MSEESPSEAVVERPPATPEGPKGLRQRSCMGSWAALVGVLIGAVYVINPGAGVFEVVPDIVPVLGNLDDAAATTMLVLGLQYLFGRDRAG